MVITATERNQIMYLVVGMFDGVPGATYLSQFTDSVMGGQSIEVDLAKSLTKSDAFLKIYPSFQTSTEFATAFAENLLGNTVSAANKTNAITIMVKELDNGMERHEVMVAAIKLLISVDASDANWGQAKQALDNKVDVANWFTIDQGIETTDVAVLQKAISTVTEDVATATAAKDEKNLPGEAKSFTSNIDSITGSSGSDQFSGVIDASGTLQVGDSLNGNGGFDTLNVVAVNAGLDTSVTNITNIDSLVITENGIGNKPHNLSTMTGLQKLVLNTPGEAVTTISGLATTTEFTVNSMQKGDAPDDGLVLNYSDAADTGDQTAKITLADTKGGSVTAAGIERVELTTTGTSDATAPLTFSDAKHVLITGTTNLTSTITTAEDATVELVGAGKIDLGILADNVDTVTATGNTGGVTLTLDSEKNTIVNLGTGDDTVTTAAAYITADAAKVTAGEGSDTLIITDSTHVASAGHFVGFEKAILSDNVTVDADNIAGVTSLEIKAIGAGKETGVTDMTSAQAGAVTLRAAAANSTLVLGVKGADTVNQIDTVNLTIDDGAPAATAATNVEVTKLKMEDVEILNITAVDNLIATLSETDNSGINTVKIAGAGDVSLTTRDLDSANMTIDGATATGELTIDAGLFATNGVTIKGGTKNDTITGSAQADTITDGAGDDKITGGDGDDTITLGAGIDTVVFADTAANNGSDTIKGFVSETDKVDLNALTALTAVTSVTGSLTNIVDSVYFLGGQSAGSADSLASAAAAITAAASWSTATNNSNVIVVDNNSTAIYEWAEAGTNGAQTGELTLIGTFDSVLAAGDFIFA